MAWRQILSAAVLALTGCGGADDGAAVGIALIGAPDSLFERGLRLPPPARALRAATAEGLVALDEQGNVVPALAESWIVTDDGLSYIFRLRNSGWPDGKPIAANMVRDSLKTTIRALSGTTLGLDLAPVSTVRSMTGRVIEVDLSSPVPDLLQLLAQPEMAILKDGRGGGPMALARSGAVARLTMLPPETRGLPTRESWEEETRALGVRALPAAQAVDAFRDGAVDLVLGGTVADLPLADIGPLSRGTIRVDAAQGLLGLAVVRAEGLLADAGRREALAMAIERETLLAPFNLAGWAPSTRIVPAELAGDLPERWVGAPIEARRAQARARIGAYGGARRVSVSLPAGPGSDLLLREIAADWSEIGVTAVRAPEGAPADLMLLDSVARFMSPRWYLNQLACPVRRALCVPEADELVREAASEPDPARRATLLAEAEARLTAANTFITLGAPVRWSLARGQIAGFVENRWAVHPLPPLAEVPN